jgi:hypothetical protein
MRTPQGSEKLWCYASMKKKKGNIPNTLGNPSFPKPLQIIKNYISKYEKKFFFKPKYVVYI